MKIRPLQGQVLVQMRPADEKSDGGLHIPEVAQEKPMRAVVIRTGTWAQAKKNGALIAYDVSPGDTVLVHKHAGVQVDKANLGNHLKLVRADDIIAILT